MRAAQFLIASVVATAAVHGQLVTNLSPETDTAFDQYIAKVEPGLLAEAKAGRALPWSGLKDFSRVRKGEIEVRGFTGNNGLEVKDGLLHDWSGAMFIPGGTVAGTVAVLQDFARHKDLYPEIIDSKLRGKSNGTVAGSWTMKKHKVITVVLRADLDSSAHEVAPGHAYLVSRTGPVIEVADYGKREQKDYPARRGHGFLWRFNGYWNLHEADGGVYVECRVVSLSRDVPTGLGWIVRPFIRDMPRESLESTLKNTRAAVAKR
jgi:hypothetical protein